MTCDGTGDMPEIFDCRMCGDCCKGYGGTIVSERDIIEIAAYIGENPRQFVAKFCQMSGNRPVLGQGANGYCIFWDGLCTIHPVKPRMCRAWPYIEAIRVDVGNWYAMAASCPGMRTDVSERIVRACVAAVLAGRTRNP